MAQSPAHRLGQIIGKELEAAVHKSLLAIAEEFGLYLDYEHSRPARKGRIRVPWADSRGNTHDLDYVLEEGGTEQVLGSPRAFIETAWRRYTKHSRNKVQEIQGALSPLAERYQTSFLGAVLAGVFTEGSIAQLQSHNFNIVHLPYDTIVKAFEIEGVDISFDEDTSERELQLRVDAYEHLGTASKNRISDHITRLNALRVGQFFETLRTSIRRRIVQVSLLTLSGISHRFPSIYSAIRFISDYDESTPAAGFIRYELNVRYSNGDELRGSYTDRRYAIQFLQSLSPESLQPQQHALSKRRR